MQICREPLAAQRKIKMANAFHLLIIFKIYVVCTLVPLVHALTIFESQICLKKLEDFFSLKLPIQKF